MPAGDRHGWNSLEGYLNAHHGNMRDFLGHFVVVDGIDILLSGPEAIQIEGRLHCRGGLFLDVRKTLDMNERRHVRTVLYSYYAGIVGEPVRTIFRYDNAHPHSGHPDAHHKHCFDVSTWTEIKPPQWIGYAAWPTLRDVIEELDEWWSEHGQFLALTDDNDEPAT
jgi:hypothetical protein